jgi:tetratricopeptide (TPR) repeat protein
VDLTPEGHPDQARQLQSLSTGLVDRYWRLGDPKDLEGAQQTSQKAVDLIPEGHPDRAYQLQNLAMSLTNRYQGLGELKDLEAALQTNQEAVDLTAEGHPDRAGRLQSLAALLLDRYQRLGNLQDFKAGYDCYDKSFKLATSSPEQSWEAALHWAHSAEHSQSSFLIPAYKAAFAQLPELLWIGHSIPVRHDVIHRLDIPDATSRAVETCINLSNLCAAVEFLEQGIATIFQQTLQLKTDVDFLPPEQAKAFLDLSLQLHDGTSPEPITIVEDRKKLLQDIRTQPGLEYFLLPKSYNVLCHASQGGPVVILTSHEVHCGAIIIPNPTSEPVHVPLPNVTQEVLQSQRNMLKELLGRCNVRNREQSLSSRLLGSREQFSSKPTEECFEDLLRWLWTHIVDPIYQILKSVSS